MLLDDEAALLDDIVEAVTDEAALLDDIVEAVTEEALLDDVVEVATDDTFEELAADTAKDEAELSVPPATGSLDAVEAFETRAIDADVLLFAGGLDCAAPPQPDRSNTNSTGKDKFINKEFFILNIQSVHQKMEYQSSLTGSSKVMTVSI